MRLWHQDLIGLLPRQQLLGQHRECCALRGGGWMRPHATVNYVFTYPFEYLVQYHQLVMNEMEKRGYQVTSAWRNPAYRGKRTAPFDIDPQKFATSHPIYPEHNQNYLQACVENLGNKGVRLMVDR